VDDLDYTDHNASEVRQHIRCNTENIIQKIEQYTEKLWSAVHYINTYTLLY